MATEQFDPQSFQAQAVGENQSQERRSISLYDTADVSLGRPKHENVGINAGVQPYESSTTLSSATSAFESLSVRGETRYNNQEHLDAADFHTYQSRNRVPIADSNGRDLSTNALGDSGAQSCPICLVPMPSCVMVNSSLEARRLKETIIQMRNCGSRSQAVAIGMDFMNSYVEAYDNQWKLDDNSTRDKLRKNLAADGGKMLAETSQGWSPIVAFASLGKTELVAVLIHEGVDVNAPIGEQKGRVLAHASAWCGNDDVVRLLLAAGGDPNMQNIHGLTALHSAAAAGNVDAVKLLLKAGADPNIKATGINGTHSMPVFSQLRDSQSTAYHKIIDLLLRSGASTEWPSASEWTPLQYISIIGSVDLAKRLIETGVSTEPLKALRKKAGDDWGFSGYYPDWASRLEKTL